MCGGCPNCLRAQGRYDDAGDEFPYDLEIELEDHDAEGDDEDGEADVDDLD